MTCSFILLDPPIPLLTPKGKGLAFLLRDYGIEHHDYWTVALDESGEVWTFANPEIRFQLNPTLGRNVATAPFSPRTKGKRHGNG